MDIIMLLNKRGALFAWSFVFSRLRPQFLQKIISAQYDCLTEISNQLDAGVNSTSICKLMGIIPRDRGGPIYALHIYTAV